MEYFKAFIGGFVATLVCHQGVYTLFYMAGAALPAPPFNMAATAPLGIPAVISLAFWGGIWGLPIWWMLRNAHGAGYWLRALILGAVLPSAVALFIVFPIKGMAFAAGWNPQVIIGALILNGAWGLGVALFMCLANRPAGAPAGT
ncbi:MAG: hypothetical protein KAG72_11395 [Abyssibacter sp.]|nr:hypothetical protein [Abyssibacter sp.]MCK5859941.1 hypothetical protein [Abyssibacter sp.]